MSKDIREAVINNLSHTQNTNRNLLEKALQMRCEGYLAQAKTTLLTRTIFEVNRGKKEVRNINNSLMAEQEIIRKQKQELEEVNQLLEEANTDLEAYAYTISHDLKNPIHATLGFCELLKMEADNLSDTARKYIDLISSSVGSMAEQIDGLLQLSHTSGGELTYQQVNLSQLANDVINELKIANSDRQIEIEIEPELFCTGDIHLLKSLLQNLLSNAWKYTQGVSPAKVRFSRFMDKDDKTVFKIEDNGVGFDMSGADRLFQPFQRQHKKEEFEGTGIGLATVKRIILRHHGQVWAESEVGQGTSIFFSLPHSLQ